MKSFTKRSAYTKKINAVSSLRYRIYLRKTARHLYITLFDNIEMTDIFSVNTLQFNNHNKNNANIASASSLAEVFGKKYLDFTQDKAFFDRRKYKYHGNIKCIAEILREKNVIA